MDRTPVAHSALLASGSRLRPWDFALWLRETVALLMVLVTACTGTPRVVRSNIDPYEAELAAARYELHVLTANTGPNKPVPVSGKDFQRAMQALSGEIQPCGNPSETARWLMEGSLQADLLAEVSRGRVVRLTPLEDSSPLEAASASEMKRRYLSMCQQEYGGGDCLGLLTDGASLTREDLRTLGLALSLKGALQQTRVALKDMVSLRALIGMIVWTGCLYLLLWMLPEPTSKLLAASLTLAMLAWLPVHTVWSLMDGWGRLVHDVDRATSYERLEEASEHFSRSLGENTARVLVMLVTAALTGSASQFAAKLPKLPGFAQAASRAEAQGLSLTAAGDAEAVALAEEQTFTLMVRRPSGEAAAEAVEARIGAATIIRHQGGNRQVFLNGQRWHVPASKSVRDIPAKDSVGDELQAAATQAARRWGPRSMGPREAKAVADARAEGAAWKAHLLEREARGRFVHRVVADQFNQLRWNPRGVDAIDPQTGYKYELLTQTASNLERHGRRMSEELFRMISF